MNTTHQSKMDPRLASVTTPAAQTVVKAPCFSGFFLTYVYNKNMVAFGDEAKEFASRLESAVSVFIDQLSNYLRFNEGSLADIEKVDAISGIEQGTKTMKNGGHVHAHIVIRIWHNANLQLDLKKIQADLDTALAIEGKTKLDNKLIRESFLDKYVFKTLAPLV